MKDLVNGAGNEIHFTSYWSLLSWLMWNIYMNVWSSRLNMDLKPHLYKPGFLFWIQTRCIKTASFLGEMFKRVCMWKHDFSIHFESVKPNAKNAPNSYVSQLFFCADWKEIVINFSAASTTTICQIQKDKLRILARKRLSSHLHLLYLWLIL